jgi:ABC-2 type transport system ATP-binding protein
MGSEKTVILSTHILQEVEALCDRILILNEGLIAASGTRDEIASRLKGGQQYTLTMKTRGALGREDLQRIPHVSAVESFREAAGEGDFRLYEAGLSLEAGIEGGDLLFEWAVSRGVCLRSLVKERYSLEALFSRLTGETGEAAETAAGSSENAEVIDA